MNMKPYYDPITKETYRKSNYGGISFKFITGSVSLKGDPESKVHSYKVEKNEFGEIIKKTRFDSHIVCCGTDKCIECGRNMKG